MVVFVVVVLISVPLIPIFGSGLLILGIYYVYITRQYKKLAKGSWERFGTINGWGVDYSRPNQSLIPPSIRYGDSQVYSSILKANLSGVECSIFSYETKIGAGKVELPDNFDIAVIELPKSLPHIILNTTLYQGVIQKEQPNHEKLKLEGDFSKYFNLIVEKGNEVDVLAIITPEIMQALIEYGHSESIEIFQDKLYFISYSAGELEPIQALVNSVSGLSGQIIENVSLQTAKSISKGSL